jgi:hypothetical protein
MDADLWVIFGIICAVVVLLVYIGDRMQARYYRNHPPDDWDGMREDKHEDD